MKTVSTYLEKFPATVARAKSSSVLLGMLMLGCLTFASGFRSEFVGDDVSQIVSNIPVHSIQNIRIFFEGGTFYNGQGLAAMSGAYYRPLMTTVYSLIYTLFGAHPLAFHVGQLILHVLAAFVLFLVLRYFFKPALALFLSLVFLVHPMNSQSVYSIAAMQEPLFFLFGITAIWVILCFRQKSRWHLALTLVLLSLSILSKETGALFAVIALVYTFAANKKHFWPLLGYLVLLVPAYLVLRYHTVGFHNPHLSPIDDLSLELRLLNVPSLIAFYLWRFLFPLQLAHEYYWAYTALSFKHVVLPFIFVMLLIGLFVALGKHLYISKPGSLFFKFIFFSFWFVLGMSLCLQIIPLDMTACETWLYFAMVGLLGVIGVAVEIFSDKIPQRLGLIVGLAILLVLSIRTDLRGFDWANQLTLASRDLRVSKEDYPSDTVIANDYYFRHEYSNALTYAKRSIDVFPSANGYNTLGNIYTNLHQYAAAQITYDRGLKLQSVYYIYDNMARNIVLSGIEKPNISFVIAATKHYPTDGYLWFCLAILENRVGNNDAAMKALVTAKKYGNFNLTLYNAIANNQLFVIPAQ